MSVITPDGGALQLKQQLESLCYELESMMSYLTQHKMVNGSLEAVAVKFVEDRIKILITTSKALITPIQDEAINDQIHSVINSPNAATAPNSPGSVGGTSRRKLYHKSLQTYERRSTDDLISNSKVNNFIAQQQNKFAKPAPPAPPIRQTLSSHLVRGDGEKTIHNGNNNPIKSAANPPPIPNKPSPSTTPQPSSDATNHAHSSVVVAPTITNLKLPIRPSRSSSSNSAVISRPTVFQKDKFQNFVYPTPNKMVIPPRVASTIAMMSATGIQVEHSNSQNSSPEAPPSAQHSGNSHHTTNATSAPTSSVQDSFKSSSHFRSLAALNRLREAKTKVSSNPQGQNHNSSANDDTPQREAIAPPSIFPAMRSSHPPLSDGVTTPPAHNRGSKRLPTPPLKGSAPASSLNLPNMHLPLSTTPPNHAINPSSSPPSSHTSSIFITPTTTPTTASKTANNNGNRPTPPPRGRKIQSSVRNTTREIVETRLGADATPAERKQWKRLCAVEELIVTEAEYNNHLVFAINNFLMPCRDGNIINSSEIYDLFGNIEDILAVSEKLLAAFEFINLKSTDPEDQKIGKIFLDIMKNLQLYSDYCINQEHSNDRFNKLKEHNSEFRTLLQTVHAMPETKSLDLSAYLIKPFQRIMKYPLLLSSIINDTDPSHPDYPDLVQALKELEGMVGTANEQKRLYENITKMTELHVLFGEALRPFNVSLTDPDRLYITEGDFKVGIDGAKLEKMKLYLFNDILIIVAKQKIKGVVPLSKCVVWDLSDSVVSGKSVTNAFEIVQTDDKRRVVVSTPGRAEKEAWMTRFNECVAQFW